MWRINWLIDWTSKAQNPRERERGGGGVGEGRGRGGTPIKKVGGTRRNFSFSPPTAWGSYRPQKLRITTAYGIFSTLRGTKTRDFDPQVASPTFPYGRTSFFRLPSASVTWPGEVVWFLLCHYNASSVYPASSLFPLEKRAPASPPKARDFARRVGSLWPTRPFSFKPKKVQYVVTFL